MNAVTTVMIRAPQLTNLENEYFCEERRKRDTFRRKLAGIKH